MKPSVILDHAEQMIFALAEAGRGRDFRMSNRSPNVFWKRSQEYSRRESHALTGLATGFRELDEMTSGLQQTDLIIVAARPSMGKTAFCLTVAKTRRSRRMRSSRFSRSKCPRSSLSCV